MSICTYRRTLSCSKWRIHFLIIQVNVALWNRAGMHETEVVQLAMHKAFPPGPQHPLQQKCSWAASTWIDKGKPRTLPLDTSQWEPLLPPLCIAQERNEGGIPWKLYLLPADNMLTHSVLDAQNNSLSDMKFSLCVKSCLTFTPPNTSSTPLHTNWSFWIS